jgi:alpha-D-xyloside xylohydrolase
MVRPNTVLPVGGNADRPDYPYADGVVYHVFELDEDGVASALAPAPDGSFEATAKARRVEARIEVSVQGATKPWSVLLRGVAAVDPVEGGAARNDALGTYVTPDAGVQILIVHLGKTP